ncbi:MAG: DUF1467 family protein [Alphaproteobacteria bacterium]|jgi:predicted secreted protein|nr:DUF1467 family protein [Alphaproteobacteria bacterium]
MDPVGAIVIFILGWWMSFFAVLPIGVRGQFEDGEVTEGTEAGAPSEPMLKKKVIWATIGAVIVTLIAHFIVVPWFQSLY